MNSIFTKSFLVVLLSFSITNTTLAQTVFQPFHKDTIYNFIKNNGKDSLLNLLNNKIDTAFEWLKINASHDAFTTSIFEMKLYAKHFCLTTDSNFFLIDTVFHSNYTLYNNYLRPLIADSSEKDPLKYMNADTVKNLMRGAVGTFGGRIGFAIFGKYINVTDSIFYMFYNYASKANTIDKIDVYWSLTEYQRNSGRQDSILRSCRRKLFAQIYKKNNLQTIYMMPEINNPDNLEAYATGYNTSLRTLAYGLYGNNLDLEENGADLMYLLNLQNEDGGFRSYKLLFVHSQQLATIYALWSLCEFREKIELASFQ